MSPLLQRRMITWTFVLVVVMGIFVVVSMLKPPTPMDELSHSRAYLRAQKQRLAKERLLAAQTMTLASSDAEQRIPASFPTGHSTRAQNREALDYRIDCQIENEVHVKKEVKQIRLQGTVCKPNDEILSSEIRNETNGFSATVFKTSPHAYSTDYISLQNGKNRIRVLHYLKSGGRDELEVVTYRE